MVKPPFLRASSGEISKNGRENALSLSSFLSLPAIFGWLMFRPIWSRRRGKNSVCANWDASERERERETYKHEVLPYLWAQKLPHPELMGITGGEGTEEGQGGKLEQDVHFLRQKKITLEVEQISQGVPACVCPKSGKKLSRIIHIALMIVQLGRPFPHAVPRIYLSRVGLSLPLFGLKFNICLACNMSPLGNELAPP